MKIGLGTAQFGMRYGITNTNGVPDESEVREILSVAQGAGVKLIDTAALYGSSESVLGAALSGEHAFQIVTKTKALGESLQRLRQQSIYGLLIHDADELLGSDGDKLYRELLARKSTGVVRKIGVSIYTGEQIDAVLARYTIDLIQLPLNVLDQRLIRSGHLKKLKDRGIEIHSRSAFLQGLLLMDPGKSSAYFDSVRAHLEKVRRSFETKGLDALSGSLAFALNVPEVDRVLIGVSTAAELRQILKAAEAAGSCKVDGFRELAWHDERILNPGLWETG